MPRVSVVQISQNLYRLIISDTSIEMSVFLTQYELEYLRRRIDAVVKAKASKPRQAKGKEEEEEEDRVEAE